MLPTGTGWESAFPFDGTVTGPGSARRRTRPKKMYGFLNRVYRNLYTYYLDGQQEDRGCLDQSNRLNEGHIVGGFALCPFMRKSNPVYLFVSLSLISLVFELAKDDGPSLVQITNWSSHDCSATVMLRDAFALELKLHCRTNDIRRCSVSSG